MNITSIIQAPGLIPEAINFTYAKAEEAYRYHQTIPEYAETPLINLAGLAKICQVNGIYVKDESKRFGLNAFKGLGGSFAMNRLTYGGKIKRTFVTATDGNHGRGVAWAAKMLGQEAHVYMPRGTAQERLENIRKLGAHAEILDLIYDDCVRYATEQAEKNGWVLIQDTSWEGYEEIPLLIMQGYTTIGVEVVKELGDIKPTHIFLQAGVGSMAGAMCSFFADYYKASKPTMVIVEPDGAACIYETAKASDGALHAVRDLHTIMAGLNCGEPCTLAWEMIRHTAEYAISCPDYVSANGMRILGSPAVGDVRIISGESGAVTIGAVVEMTCSPKEAYVKETLGIDQDSVILCISTEGDTDQKNYRDITWYGAFSFQQPGNSIK